MANVGFSTKSKVVGGILAIAIIIALVQYSPLKKILFPEGKTASTELSEDTKKLVDEGTPIVNVGVVTWGGYAGGQYFNNGFKPSITSRYYSQYKMLVNFIVIDDFEASRAAWKADEIQLLWVTADAYTTETEALAEYKPQFVFQSDWSRGGDAIVVAPGIKSVNDFRGKKIAVALGTPSHTMLLMMLEAANIKTSEVEVVGMKSAIDAASAFKSGAVQIAVVWSPDDLDCTRSVDGSKILKSTKEASHIIADGFFVKNDYLQKNFNLVKNLVEGWLIGAKEINTESTAKEKAIQILVDGLKIDKGLAENAINNVRLTTFGDNQNFFNINGNYPGITGDNLYSKMGRIYREIGFIKNSPPLWRDVSNASVIRAINLSGPGHEAEEEIKFSAPTKQDYTAPAFSTKGLTINFATGSATLDETAKEVIAANIGRLSQMFGGSKIRIEGNTDNVGSHSSNVDLSKRRAQSVIDYLVVKYNFDRNKFLPVGHGPDNPVADNNTPEGRAANRRTDFVIL